MGRVENMVAELLDMTPEDQEQVKALLAQVSSEPSDDSVQLAGKPHNAVELVWGTIAKLAKARGIVLPPASIIVRHKSYPKLVNHCKAFERFVDKFGTTDRGQRMVARELCVDALFRFMRKIPITVATVTNYLPLVSQAVDKQLPGYAEAGMLPVAISGLKPVTVA